MNKFLISLCVVGVLFGAGCKTVSEFFGGEELVITTQENVADGASRAVIPVDQLPENLKGLVPTGTQFVVSNADDLKSENAPHFPIVAGEGSAYLTDTSIGTAFDAVMTIGKTVFPALAGWEALLAVFFKRKRKHYANAIKSLVPTDKNVDVGSALASVTAALGMTHSSSTTEEAWTDEMEMDMEEV